MKNKRLLSLLLITIVILFVCPINVFAEVKSTGEVDIYDYAELLSSSMEDELEDLGEEYADDLGFDIVFLTIDEAENAETYSDDFYDGLKETGKKYGKDGIIFVININTDYRELYIGTTGNAIEWLNDYEIDDSLNAAHNYASIDDYDEAMYAMAENALETIEYNKDNEPGFLEQIAPSGGQIILSILAGVSTGVILYKKHNKANKQINAECYAVGKGIEVMNRNSRLINQYDTVLRNYYKPKSSSSSGGRSGGSSHRSSSGRSHGGGGRRF